MALAATILGCMGLVLWIRMLPQSLPMADDWAEAAVRRTTRRAGAGVPAGQPQGAAAADTHTVQPLRASDAPPVAEQARLARTFRSELSFEAPDRRAHVYLGDLDSYHWLRLARNLIRHGTVCDAVVDGQCRDTYTNAPVGSRMIYTRSIHTAAIAGLHAALCRFRPGQPLPYSAFLVPVVVGVLGVVPAFLMGLRLAGAVAGLFAAVFISLNPVFLQRSMGSDNDVWTVVLPLCVMALLTAGLAAEGRLRPLVYGVLAGIVTALLATTWRGWLFAYVVALAALLVHAVMDGVRHWVRLRSPRHWQSSSGRRTALLGVAYWAATEVLTRAAGHEKAYLSTLSLLSREDIAFDEPGHWPYVLKTVEEFGRLELREIVAAMGGWPWFLAGAVGLLLLVLPRRGGRRAERVAFFLAVLVQAVVITWGPLGREWTVAVFAVPVAGMFVLQLLDRSRAEEGPRAESTLVAVWFLAALFLAHDGIRFLLLLGPPLGLCIGAAAGRLAEWLRSLGTRLQVARRRPGLAAALVVGGLSSTLLLPIRQGHAAARGYVPRMDDAWWSTLEKIKAEAAPDAIVNTWWDHGYWVKYVAERRVSATGGALLTHLPHWLAKALLAPSERQTVGILRMLDCGSDTMPATDGRRGAYGKILSSGRDAVTAYSTVLALADLDAEEARAYLARRGFSPLEQADVLASSHCDPPEGYLVLSSDLLKKAEAWMYLGSWDMRRADAVRQARRRPREEVVADLVARFEYTAPEAMQLYEQSSAVAAETDFEDFVAPARGRAFTRWSACRDASGSDRTTCAIDVAVRPDGASMLIFAYDPAAPADGRLRLRGRSGDEQEGSGTPAVLVLAGPHRVEEVVFPAPAYPWVGILLDLQGRRILAGAPELVRSTFTRLMYLDGRGAAHFEKFDERTTTLGNRVVAWRVKWPGGGAGRTGITDRR